MEERWRTRADPAVPLSEALLCLSTPEGWRCLIVFGFFFGPDLTCSRTGTLVTARTPGLAHTAAAQLFAQLHRHRVQALLPQTHQSETSPFLLADGRGIGWREAAGGGRRWREVAGGGGRRREEVGGEGGVCARVRHIGKKRKKKEKNKEIPFTRISTNTHT